MKQFQIYISSEKGRMKAFVVSTLLFAAALAVVAVPANAQKDAATLTLQFDNTKQAVPDETKKKQVLKALADDVFKVPVGQVKVVSSLDQSSLTNSQSIVIFSATGPATNKQKVLKNCQDNTKGGFLGLTSSTAEKAVKNATDTWWPGDSVKIQKASCAQA